MKIQLLLIICGVIVEIGSYRILGVFPMNSKSHNNMFDPLMKGLAKRGHKIDVISHFELKNPPDNYKTIINLHGTRQDLTNNVSVEFASQIGHDPIIHIATTYGNDFCDLMALEKMQKFIKNPPHHYDLVITEAFSSSCYIGLGYVLKAPVITVSTLLDFSWVSEAIGNPSSAAFATNVFMNKAFISTFFERLQSTFVHHITRFRFQRLTEKRQTEAMRKYLDPKMPNVRIVERTVALMFTNYHHSVYGPKPFTTAVIPIAGIHAEQNDDEFTPELKQWMDKSTRGVVYFSLGSMILIESLPSDILLAFYASFSKLAPIKVLMKVANRDKLLPGLPDNVMTSSWIPQVPVLRHNNTKVFITHGGLMGTLEALYYGVPLIGLPFFSDQLPNMEIYVKKNMAIRLDKNAINEEKITEALNSILTDPKYKNAAKLESLLFRDRPMSILDTANFWVEYVIRNGPNALRSPAIDLHWWQVELLDVYAFILLSTTIIITIIVVFVKKILQMVLRKFSNPQNSKKNQ